MKKILLTADWHLDSNPRDAYRFGVVERIRRVVKDNDVDHLFILGDLTEHADHHSAAFTNAVVDTLTAFAKLCRVIIIRGNHDASDPSMPFFRFINAIPNLHFLTELRIIARIALIPHGCWPERMPPECDMILTHHTFAGAKSESGKHLGGLRMPMGSLPIYSGDIHVPQTHGLLTYVGAPTRINFGDDFQPRVILFDDGKPRSIPINAPTKRLVEVIAHPDGRLDWMDATVNDGDIVKVRVYFSGALPSLAHLRADIADAVLKRAEGVTLFSVIPMLERDTASIPSKPVSRSDADLVRQYGATRSFDQPTIDAGLAIVKG